MNEGPLEGEEKYNGGRKDLNRKSFQTRWIMRIVLLLPLFITTALGQSVESPCALEPEVKGAFWTWDQMDEAVVPYKERHGRRLKLVQQLLEKYPKDIQVHFWRWELLAGPMGETWEAATEEYRRLYAANPDDPIYQFLYASLITGRNTPQAITILEQLAGTIPTFAPAHRSLGRIYQFPAFEDTKKAIEHLEAFQSICPDSASGMAAGSRLHDPAFIERSLTRLQRMVKDPENLQHYPLLWSFAFRSQPTNLHDKVREEVREDVERLRAFGLNGSIDWYRTLEDGYRLLGDDEGQRWINEQIQEHFPRSEEAVWRAYRSWVEAHPFSGFGDAEALEQHGRALLAQTDRWIKRWPMVPIFWSTRLGALMNFRQPPPEIVASTVDRLIEAGELQPEFGSLPPVAYSIAEAYLKSNVRIGRIPRLVEIGSQELLERDSWGRGDSHKPDQQLEGNFFLHFSEGGPLKIESYLRRRMFVEARQVLHDMESWLRESRCGLDAAEQAKKKKRFTRKESLLWEMRGRLAEAEDRKPDAAVCYLTAARLNPEPPRPRVFRVNPEERGRTLWKEMGGTLEGLQAFNEHLSSNREGEESSVGNWQRSAKPLPEFEITDIEGRLWSLRDLKGKNTLVNLWATWCGWCLRELPAVQNMHDELKERADIQVITLNLDENPGLIEPFIAKHSYSFPVLPATALVDQFNRFPVLPTNWIVDTQGFIAYEQRGFNSNQPPEQWLQKRAIELMEALE